jgi:asparagine synthase (glutamine-hydrolysing)
MPGIAGIFGPGNEEQLTARLHSMVAAMRHEPSYTAGTHVDASLGIYVGWVAHPGSVAAAMPAWNGERNVCVILTGQEFTERDTAKGPEPDDSARGPGPGRYLVERYLQRGADFLEQLNGWFSGVVIDTRQRRVLLFNDRYGLERIHFHEHASGFHFGSEAKSLLRVLPELREIEPGALAETLSCGCVLGNRTLFPGVALLPGASRWTLTSHAGVGREHYWSRDRWEGLPKLTSADYAQRLKETFARILPRYVRADDRIAMSLTGGLDGRMIMAWANAAPGSLPCYTFGGEYRDCADVRIARRIASLCGQEHQTIAVGQGFCDEFPSLAERSVYISDGTMDVTGAVELYANRRARDIAPIRLTGNYGSEIVRGNVAFRPGSVDTELLNPDFVPLVRTAEHAYRRAREDNEVSFIAFRQVPWFHYARYSIERSQLTPRSPYLDNELVSLMYQAPEQSWRSKSPSLDVIADGDARLAAVPTDRGDVGTSGTVAERLHQRYQEFTFKAEYAYDYGMPQWLAAADHVLARLRLERMFLGRHKFYHFRVWYRDRLAGYIQDVLLDPRARTRPYVDGRNLEHLVNEHVRGVRNHTVAIHQALTAELTYRQLIEQTWSS